MSKAHLKGSEVVTLGDGTAVAVRLIRPDDAPRLFVLREGHLLHG